MNSTTSMTRDEIENFESYQSASEKETALFFYDIGLKCIDLCFKIKADDGSDITDIDGIFLDEENKVIIIYDDSTQSGQHNTKILSFLSKCQQDSCEKQIYDNHSELPLYPIYILYIDKSRNSGSSLEAIQHIFNRTSKVIFKDDFEYFSELSTRIGKWAKNDLYNFVEIFPPNKKVEVDAIKVYLGDTPAYLFADKPTNVLRYSYVSRRKGKDGGYQRMVDFSRISKIAKSIRGKKIEGFPNSILLNSTVELEEMEKISKSHCPKSVKLLLPDHYSSCRIVDGQHRLISFSQLSEIEQSRFTLSIVLMNNLPLEQEKKMFLDINNNAKSVDPNLEYEIFSELNCWEKGSKEEMIKLSIKIINEVERVKPLKGRLYRGRINEDKGEQVTIKSFTDSILRYKVVDKETGRFQSTENDLELPVKIFKSILAESNKKILDKGYLISNRGIDLVCNFWANVFDTRDKSTWQESIDNNIEDFTSAINDSIEPLRKLQGATGFKEAFDIIKKSIEKKSQVQEIAIAAATAVTLREHPLEKEERPG